MPYFVVKVVQKAGWHLPPIVAHFDDEEAALAAVRLMTDDEDSVEIKGLRDDVMAIAFGDVPEGCAVFRHDWVWKGEKDDIPEPY